MALSVRPSVNYVRNNSNICFQSESFHIWTQGALGHICGHYWKPASQLIKYEHDPIYHFHMWTFLRPVFNTLRPRRNRRRFADDSFKCISLNQNVLISIKIPLKFVPKGSINNTPALVQIMAWRRPGDKPLSEAMVVRLPTHICVSRPQWVKVELQIWYICSS